MSNETANIANLTALNHTDNPRALGGTMLGSDGQGNQLWQFGDKVANRHVSESSDLLWSDDVEGWGYTEADALDA